MVPRNLWNDARRQGSRYRLLGLFDKVVSKVQEAGRENHKDNYPHSRKWAINFQVSLETSRWDILIVRGEHFGALSEELALWEERFF